MRAFVQGLIGPGLLALAMACGGDDASAPAPSVPSALSKQAGDAQAGTVGQAVAVAPSVKVTDASNRGVAGVAVTFAVAGGGGTVTGASATTDANGIATVGTWTLGNAPGANSLTATAAGTGIAGNPATFTATAAAGSPRTLTKETGDAQTTSAGAAVPVAPTVKVVDQFGNPVSGVTVTFAVASGGGNVTGATPTTGANGTAAVGSWQLGPAPGANTLTATIGGAGVTGNPATFTATGTLAAFNPTASVSLGGTNNYTSVNIPAGVTVTATSDLVINATGAITIAGTVAGDCRAITISATGTLTVSGSIDNHCTTLPATVAPALSLVGRAGYTFNGAGTVRSSGNVEITNDPTLTDADFTRLRGRDLSTSSARIDGGSPTADMGNLGSPICVVIGRSFTADPARARPGTPGGVTGGKGEDGSTWTLKCRGEMQMSNTSVTGQNGGPGGQGQDLNNPAGANATGGAGGDGGKLRVLATLELDLVGNNTFTSGSGGVGGAANASGGPNPTPAQAPSAAATGGKGGNSGLIEVIGKAGISIGGLTLAVGSGAAGGSATAAGADGMDATTARAAQIGGNGTATGGAGGTSPNKTLGSSGSVVGLGNVNVTGGNGGTGGPASSTAGKGGAGILENKPGGNGGAITANGGAGGAANLRNQNNGLVGSGGAGGNISIRGGNGGLGFNDCQTPLTSGGKGGNGGNGTGNSGLGGAGAVVGTAGTILVENAGNGAKGGDGLGPGAGGTAGSQAGIGANGARTNVAPIFTDGVAGIPCPGTHNNKTAVVGPPTSDTHGHEGFIQQAGQRLVQLIFGTGTTASIGGLLANSTIVISGSRSGNQLTLSGSGIINLPGGGTRNATVTFNGTISATGITGELAITIQGFPTPTTYPVNITF